MPESPDRIKGAVFGSFIGDALSLPAHWIHDSHQIERTFQRIGEFLDPAGNPYHAGRNAGDQSHYGDQALVLMRSLEPGQGFSPTAFATRWQRMWRGYEGYVDGATRTTLAALETGSRPTDAASSSNDLAGASRIAPLFAALSKDDEETLAAAAREQTALTHGDPQVPEAAEFFARVTRHIIEGEALIDAIEKVASQR